MTPRSDEAQSEDPADIGRWENRETCPHPVNDSREPCGKAGVPYRPGEREQDMRRPG